MASNQFHQVPISYSSNIHHRRLRGHSKAQASLNKILHTISNAAPPINPQFHGLSDEGRAGFGINLNLRLGSLLENESPAGDASSIVETVVEESNTPAAVDKSSVDEYEAILAAEKGTEALEITRSFEIDDIEVCEDREGGGGGGGDGDGDGVETKRVCRKEYKRDGFLGLLIEAAEFISGEFKEDEPEQLVTSRTVSEKTETAAINESTRNSKSKGKECWMEDLYDDFEDISPVVRSKRGRNQVLPYRYRDSVLEPWRPLSRPKSTTVSTKRRSRRICNCSSLKTRVDF